MTITRILIYAQELSIDDLDELISELVDIKERKITDLEINQIYLDQINNDDEYNQYIGAPN